MSIHRKERSGLWPKNIKILQRNRKEGTMITKETLVKAFGGPFTTRKKIATALNYKDPKSVDKYLKGLEKINGNRYYSADVADRILSDGLH